MANVRRSQHLRHSVQAVFLALNVWIGIEFYLFVHAFETGAAPAVERPPGVEGWLPIAGLMNTKYWLSTGNVPAVHPAAMWLLLAFVTMSLLLRKAFCGWLCPVGTLSEWLWRAGRSIFRRNYRLPRWLDTGLRSVKYVLLALFGYAVASMPATALEQFLTSPYGLVADVKMLNFFRYMSVTAAVTLAVLALASIFVQNFWCRYLCPYGALVGLASLMSPARITRNQESCVDCGLCARACPSRLPVDKLIQIRSAECTGCLDCVAACPVANTLDLRVARRRVPAWAMAVGIAVIFFGFAGYARMTGHWQTDVPAQTYQELIPLAREFSHP